MPADPTSANDPSLTLTFVLTRDDQAGFDRHLQALYDPSSPAFQEFQPARALADRFGPSRRRYGNVRRWLRAAGFTIVDHAGDRLTLTARGPASLVERTFDVRLHTYRRGDTLFRAADRAPAVPPAIAAAVQSISGLNDLARPRPVIDAIRKNWHEVLCQIITLACPGIPAERRQKILEVCRTAFDYNGDPYDTAFFTLLGLDCSTTPTTSTTLPPPTTTTTTMPFGPTMTRGRAPIAPGAWLGNDGSGQTIAIVAFDTFDRNDVADYLALRGLPPERINDLTQVHVNGGATAGANQAEVLLDINAALTMAPGARVVVYDAPFTGAGSFQAVFNAMINDGVTVISNSWAYCEDQTTLADVQSLDAVLANAAAAGISVFNATGDTGSTCLDGRPNTITVPAGSPNATAVGGSSLTPGAVPGIYGSETWWDGSAANPPTGQGGFGVSVFFDRPAYQAGQHSGTKRSIPDVVANADPANGTMICQASTGGCPNGRLYGGTSIAAPKWAAFAAVLNQAQGRNLGNLNPLLYPLAGTAAFHTPASMGSDFAHVGLGSPNLNAIHLALANQTAGAPSASVSHVIPFAERAAGSAIVVPNGVPADGVTRGYILVQLRDAAGNVVSGKTVTLAANPNTHVVVTPASGVSSSDNGAVVFTATNTTPETVTFTATDTTVGTVLQATAEIVFEVPAAAAGNIVASLQTVTANGTDHHTDGHLARRAESADARERSAAPTRDRPRRHHDHRRQRHRQQWRSPIYCNQPVQ